MSVTFYRDSSIPFFEIKLYNENNLCYKKHYHEEYLLAIVEQGVSRFWYDGHQVNICAGQLILIPPHIIHSCNPYNAVQWKYKMLAIHAEWVQEWIHNSGQQTMLEPVILYQHSNEYHEMMTALIACLQSDATPLEKESGMMQMFTEVFRSIHNSAAVITDDHEKIAKLKAVRAYLDEHFKEKITLDELEAISGLSKFHMVRLFGREYNIPPHAYQTLLRVNYAKRELLQQRSISTVALEVGFFDQSHFNKVFKNYVGTTPENYQNCSQ